MRAILQLALVISIFEACVTGVLAGNEAPEQRPDIKEFGKSDGQIVNSGFVFYDGKYIEAPYQVSREGLAIVINGIMVRSPLQWPPVASSNAVVRDPGDIPQGMKTNMTLKEFDAKYEGHSIQKFRYLEQNPNADVIGGMKSFYQAMPFVKSVSVVDGCILYFETKSGEKRHIYVGTSFNHGPPPSHAEYLTGVEGARQFLEQRLQAKACYFFFNDRGQMSIDWGKGREWLPRAFAILTSANSKDVKVTKLNELGLFIPGGMPTLEAIVNGFQPSQQLAERINSLK